MIASPDMEPDHDREVPQHPPKRSRLKPGVRRKLHRLPFVADGAPAGAGGTELGVALSAGLPFAAALGGGVALATAGARGAVGALGALPGRTI